MQLTMLHENLLIFLGLIGMRLVRVQARMLKALLLPEKVSIQSTLVEESSITRIGDRPLITPEKLIKIR